MASEILKCRITARSEDGQEHTIVVYEESLGSGTLNDPPGSQSTGRLRFQTTDGKRVNHIGKGKYNVFGPFGEIIVTSDDPEAP